MNGMSITIKVDDTGEVLVVTDPEEIAIQEIFFWMEAAKYGILSAMRDTPLLSEE